MRARTLLVNVSKLAGGMAIGLGLLAFSAPASQAQGTIDIGMAEGGAGTTAAVEISLNGTGDAEIVATTNDIGFPPLTGIVAKGDGSPDCTLNPSIVKPNTKFVFRPRDCTPASDCNAVRATVISLDEATSNTDIPDGLLYTCNVAIPAGATVGSQIALINEIAGITDIEREDFDVTEASADGSVEVIEPPTVTPTQTPVDTATPAPTSTNTVGATATRTGGGGGGGGGGQDDDGCQMVAPADASMGWMLLAPAALLIWRRRRAL